MPKYRILWSERGRCVVEAPSQEAASEKFWDIMAGEEPEPEGFWDDEDGREIDNVEEIEEPETHNLIPGDVAARDNH